MKKFTYLPKPGEPLYTKVEVRRSIQHKGIILSIISKHETTEVLINEADVYSFADKLKELCLDELNEKGQFLIE